MRDVSLPPERAEQVRTLFREGVDLDLDERAAYVDRASGGDDALRREVEALLQAFDQADELLQELDQQLPWLLQPASEEVDPLIGRCLSPYEILAKLGGGGMGIVYKARDLRLGRLVALKLLRPHLGIDEDAKARFVQEAKAASALDHANICTIYEIGEAEEGQLYMALAHYEGETLKQKIQRGALEVEEALSYAVQMAEGLRAAHSVGIVHRDVKPANVLVTREDTVKLVDFGTAKMAGTDVTREGVMLGTVAPQPKMEFSSTGANLALNQMEENHEQEDSSSFQSRGEGKHPEASSPRRRARLRPV